MLFIVAIICSLVETIPTSFFYMSVILFLLVEIPFWMKRNRKKLIEEQTEGCEKVIVDYDKKSDSTIVIAGDLNIDDGEIGNIRANNQISNGSTIIIRGKVSAKNAKIGNIG